MRNQRRVIIPLSLLLVFGLAVCFGQNPTPHQGPEPTPTLEQLRAMSREERIKLHQRRIEQIIQENKRRQEEEARRAAAARQQGITAPSAPGTSLPVPQPGAPIPQGPVQVYTPPTQTAPAQPAQAPPQQPTAARSEARSIIYLRPYDSVVNEGETFRTDIMVDCKDGMADEFFVVMRFPAGNLNLLAVDFSPIADYLLGNVEYVDDSQNGEVSFHLRLQQLQKFRSRPIATFYWEALAATDLAEIRFVLGGDDSTDIRANGTSILGTAPGAPDGVVNGTVLIRPKSSKPYVAQFGKQGLLVTAGRVRPPEATARLLLVSESEQVEVGEEFTVDVVLDNPLQTHFDRVRLYLQFDPKVFEVVDTDKVNWIKRGINIADGFAHTVFPFDFHRENFADNEKGVIVYDEATEVRPLRSHGTLAQITFRAKQSARTSDVVLVRNETGIYPTTAVTYLSHNILADYPQEATALAGIRLRVEDSDQTSEVREKRPIEVQ